MLANLKHKTGKLAAYPTTKMTKDTKGQVSWHQRELTLERRRRGFHLITDEILAALPELSTMRIGLLHVFILHTSASLTINENADSDVLRDMEASLNAIAPEDFPYLHTVEGPDDMPAHVKASLMGSSVIGPRPRRPARAWERGKGFISANIAINASRPASSMLTLQGESL